MSSLNRSFAAFADGSRPQTSRAARVHAQVPGTPVLRRVCHQTHGKLLAPLRAGADIAVRRITALATARSSLVHDIAGVGQRRIAAFAGSRRMHTHHRRGEQQPEHPVLSHVHPLVSARGGLAQNSAAGSHQASVLSEGSHGR